MGGDSKKLEVALSSVGGTQNGLISTQTQLADAQERSKSTRSNKLRGFEVHYTSERKPEDAPDNLFEPIEGHNVVEGSFRDRAHPRSFYNWMQMHPTVKRAAVAGIAIGALSALRRRT